MKIELKNSAVHPEKWVQRGQTFLWKVISVERKRSKVTGSGAKRTHTTFIFMFLLISEIASPLHSSPRNLTNAEFFVGKNINFLTRNLLLDKNDTLWAPVNEFALTPMSFFVTQVASVEIVSTFCQQGDLQAGIDFHQLKL